jgi:nucleoside-diphosphate-sugar epimerase
MPCEPMGPRCLRTASLIWKRSRRRPGIAAFRQASARRSLRIRADGLGSGRAVRTADLLLNVDAVVHLAALSNDSLGSLAPELTYDINHAAAVRLARMAKNAGVRRFLYASTCSVYGAAGEELVGEDAPLRR